MTKRFRCHLRINDTLVLSNLTVDPEEMASAPENPSGTAPKKAEGPRITENQRRFLFRLLAAQKIEARSAEEHLKEYFGVRAVGDIPKDQASQYIDQLVRDQQATA